GSRPPAPTAGHERRSESPAPNTSQSRCTEDVVDSIPRRARWLGVGALALVLVAVGVGFVVGSAGGRAASPPAGSASSASPAATAPGSGGSAGPALTTVIVAITVSGASCAPGWVAPPSGNTTFAISNIGNQSLDVQLLGADRVTVYAAIELLAAGTRANLSV